MSEWDGSGNDILADLRAAEQNATAYTFRWNPCDHPEIGVRFDDDGNQCGWPRCTTCFAEFPVKTTLVQEHPGYLIQGCRQ